MLTPVAPTMLLVATAADPGNLRFYQRQGFRMRSIGRPPAPRDPAVPRRAAPQ